MAVCGVCGKRIAVMWPEFWVYKHGKGGDTTYYCSENCMIVADTREMKDRIGWVDPQAEMTEEEIEAVTHGRPVGFRRLKRTARREQPAAPAGQERTGQDMGNGMNCNKLTRAQKEKAVEIAISGGDPQEWLRKCGSKNPSAAWFYIKKTVAKADPKLYEKIPEKPGMVINESGQAVPADEPEAADPLEGFVAYDPGAPEGDMTADLTINAEDLAAAEDPAVARMEAMAAETEPVVEKKSLGLDEAFQKMEEALKSPDFMEVRQTANGITIRKRKPDWEKLTFFGIPCEVTGLKAEGFEFSLILDDLMVKFPAAGSVWTMMDSNTMKLPAEQWRKLTELVPKVLKIFGMD